MIVALSVAAVVLLLWSRWLIRRARASPWLNAPVVVAALAVLGLPWLTVLGLRQTFDGIGDLSPAEKASVLAEGISRAMWWTAIASGVAAVWFVILVIAAFRVRRRQRQPAAGES